MALRDLIWSDLFVASTPECSWYKATPGSRICTPVPLDCFDEILGLRKTLEEKIPNDRLIDDSGPDADFGWEDLTLRASRISVAQGLTLFVLRRFAITDLRLSATGLPTGIIRELMSDKDALKSGVIAIVGPPGAGKSTTARALMKDRVRMYAGTGFTLEVPVEQHIQGKVGDGWIYQINLRNDDQIGPAFEALYRTVPNILMIGEVRKASTMLEVVRAAASGILVIITSFANDVVGAIRNFSEQLNMNKSETQSAHLADVLRAVIHVQLNPLPVDEQSISARIAARLAKGTGNPSQLLSAEAIFFTESREEGRAILRSGDFSQLTSVIDRQRARLMNEQELD